MKHIFKLNDYGEIDQFAYDSGIHNGNECIVCGKIQCNHCHPEWLEKDCPGTKKQIQDEIEDRKQKLNIIQKEIDELTKHIEEAK